MGTLTKEQKIFAVRSLAAYVTPTEVAAEFAQRFGTSITPSGILCYSPCTRQGGRLSSDLRALFFKERERYNEDLLAIPIASKAYRLSQLQARLESAGKNSHLALECLKMARAEMEGDRVQITGTGRNGAILTQQQGLNTSQAAAVLSAIIESVEQKAIEESVDDGVIEGELVDPDNDGPMPDVDEFP
jgi:hypothetical protein